MANVFISNLPEDRADAANVAAALERAGYSVWWWAPGAAAPKEDEIERELRAARAVIAIWSRASVPDSQFVRRTAEFARQSNKLVSVKCEACSIPLAFRSATTADLATWTGSDPTHREWLRVLRAIGALVSRPAAQVVRPHRRWGRSVAIAVLALGLVGATAFGVMTWRSSGEMPRTEAEAPAATKNAVAPAAPAKSEPAPAPAVTPPPAPSSVIEDPVWLERPGALEFQRFYPTRAMERSWEGRVALMCVVRADGRLNCSVRSVDPAGWGFEDAALNISRSYRMAARARDGSAVEGRRVPLTIAFRLA